MRRKGYLFLDKCFFIFCYRYMIMLWLLINIKVTQRGIFIILINLCLMDFTKCLCCSRSSGFLDKIPKISLDLVVKLMNIKPTSQHRSIVHQEYLNSGCSSCVFFISLLNLSFLFQEEWWEVVGIWAIA